MQKLGFNYFQIHGNFSLCLFSFVVFQAERLSENLSVPAAHVVVNENVEGRINRLQDIRKREDNTEHVSVGTVYGQLGDHYHPDKNDADGSVTDDEHRWDHHNHFGDGLIPDGHWIGLSRCSRFFPPFSFTPQLNDQDNCWHRDDGESGEGEEAVVDGERVSVHNWPVFGES